MKGRLNPRETTALYAVVLGVLFLFYLLGLFLGKDHFVEANPRDGSVPLADTPVEDLTPELDFYQRLMGPSVPERETPLSKDSMESSAEPVKESEISSSGIYTVQVGAFTAEIDTRQILIRLEAKGYASNVGRPSAEDPYYRVWVGEFKTAQEAEHMEALLRKDGFLTYLKKIQVESSTH